jgi:hypothetical protein
MLDILKENGVAGVVEAIGTNSVERELERRATRIVPPFVPGWL